MHKNTHTRTATYTHCYNVHTPAKWTRGITYRCTGVSELQNISNGISQENNGWENIIIFNSLWHSRHREDQKAEKKQNHKFGYTLREHKNEEAISFLTACCNPRKQELKIGWSIRRDWRTKGHVCKFGRGRYCFFAFRWCETEAMCNSDMRSRQQLIQGHASLEARWAKWGYRLKEEVKEWKAITFSRRSNSAQLQEVLCLCPIHTDMNNKHRNEVICLHHIMQLAKLCFYFRVRVRECIESPVSGPWISQWMRKFSVTRDCLNYVAISGSGRYRKHGAWKGNLIFNTFYLQPNQLT